MSAGPLPIVLSCPHGGLDIPPEIISLLAVDETAIYNECDLWADQLFDFGHPDLRMLTPAEHEPGVLARVSFPITRALVDVNRPSTDWSDPDGPIKSCTSYGQNTYTKELGLQTKQDLTELYWRPYHARLNTAWHQHAHNMKLFLDCHNMAQHGPSAYAHPGAARR